jgi:hypothetical protein
VNRHPPIQNIHHRRHGVDVQCVIELLEVVDLLGNGAPEAHRAGGLHVGDVQSIQKGQLRVHEITQRLLEITVAIVADAGHEAHHGGLAHLAGLGQFLGGHEHRFAWLGYDVLSQNAPFGRECFDTRRNFLDQGDAVYQVLSQRPPPKKRQKSIQRNEFFHLPLFPLSISSI